MKLNEIQDIWEVDSVIDDVLLDSVSVDTNKLHNKYFIILNGEKIALKKLEFDKKVLVKDKYEYYNGTIDEETLKKRNWLPFGDRILKSNISMYIDADGDFILLEKAIENQKLKVDYLMSIIDQINKRTFLIKNAIEWRRFTAGLS
jgi:hypothetical protein